MHPAEVHGDLVLGEVRGGSGWDLILGSEKGAGGSPRQAVAVVSGAYPAWQWQRKEPRLLMHSP